MDNSGWIHVITGPMFSGKTEALIRILRRYDIMGKKVILFRPSIDTRTAEVESRSGVTYPAIAVSSVAEIDTTLIRRQPDIIAFDEAQFFLDINLANIVQELAEAHRKRVIVSGLDKDFLKRPFGQMGDILVMADEVDKLTAMCAICISNGYYAENTGHPATLTQRLINGEPASYSDPLIVVGGMGDDKYEARCRLHHKIRYHDR